MWIVKIVTFVEYHPYLFLLFVLVIFGVIWFFWREHKRPSYKQKKELEQFLKGFDETRNVANNAQKKIEAVPTLHEGTADLQKP